MGYQAQGHAPASAEGGGGAAEPSPRPGRPRRRGSVVKSQMHGSTGDHVQPSSASAGGGFGEDIPVPQDLPAPEPQPRPQAAEEQPQQPERRRPRRRGSVVKSQMHGSDGDHVQPSSGGTGADIPDTNEMASIMADSPSPSPAAVENDGAKQQRRKKQSRKAIHGIAMDMDFELKVVPKSEDEQELIYEAIKTNTLFKACTDEEFVDIVDAFEPRSCAAGSIVIKEGDEGDLFYVMERGGVDVFEKDRRVCSLFSGAAFGEIALLYGCPRTATLRAKYDCKLWVIDRRTFRGITGQHKRRLLEKKLDFLKKVKIHNRVLGEVLDISELQDMAVATQSEQFAEGEAIVTQGERGDVFYMIVEGTVDVYIKEKGNRPVVTLKSGQFFGEKALLSADVRTATCVASSHVKCMYLMRDDFNLLLGDLQDLLNRSYEDRRDYLLPLEAEPAESMDVKTSQPEFSIDDFDVKRTLGVGAFGYVKLVRLKNSDRVDGSDDGLYALKCISKEKIAEHKHQDKIINEESIMTELVHPFIARCFCAMQDNKAKYFLMEALCGGELCELLYNEKMFTEDWSRFYSASVLLAFCCMHARKIAYRDLKPENLVLNASGYVKIVDFGLAKRLSDGRTHTFCGTPDYLAPEIILNEAYDWAVDYWGLGILLYEMTAGEAPFAAENPMDVYEKVLAGEFVVPPHFSRELEDLIRRLLHTSQSKRLGKTRGGGEAVMKHHWYSGFDWDALLAYKMRVPFIPRVKDEDDDSFCDEDQEEGFANPIL